MSEKDKGQEESVHELQMRLRRSVGNAYAFVLADQNTQTIASFTLEDALDLQIESIEGGGTQLRPNKLDRLERIKQEIVTAVEQIKELPPEYFQDPDETKDVNTT